MTTSSPQRLWLHYSAWCPLSTSHPHHSASILLSSYFSIEMDTSKISKTTHHRKKVELNIEVLLFKCPIAACFPSLSPNTVSEVCSQIQPWCRIPIWRHRGTFPDGPVSFTFPKLEPNLHWMLWMGWGGLILMLETLGKWNLHTTGPLILRLTGFQIVVSWTVFSSGRKNPWFCSPFLQTPGSPGVSKQA